MRADDAHCVRVLSDLKWGVWQVRGGRDATNTVQPGTLVLGGGGGGRDTVPKRKQGAALVGGSEWVLVVQRALALLNASHGPSSLSPLDVR